MSSKINLTEKYEEETLLYLKQIFNTQLLTMNLLKCDTREKMMNMLHHEGSNQWTADQILKLADDNKIEWVKDNDDPTNYDTYKREMNVKLVEILRTN